MTDKPKKRARRKAANPPQVAASEAKDAAPARPGRDSPAYLVPVLVSVAASLVAVGVLALIVGPSLVPEAPAPASDLDGRLARLEAQPSDAGAVSRSLDSFAARLDAQDVEIRAATERLNARLDALDNATARDRAAREADIDRLVAENARLGTAIDELTKDLSQRADSQRDAGALLLVVGQLRAVAASGPFADELEVARLLADRAPGPGAAFAAALDRLASHAAAGATSSRLLRERFGAVARAVIHAEQAQGAEGWLDKAAAEIKQLITVRRVGPDVPGDGAEAVLARAETALAAGDVTGAVAALETLGPLTEAAQPWLDEARARRDIAAALDELISLAIAASGRGDG